MPQPPSNPLLDFLRQLINNVQQPNTNAYSPPTFSDEEILQQADYTAQELNSYNRVSIFLFDVANAVNHPSPANEKRRLAALKQLRKVRNDEYFSINEICRAWQFNRLPDLEALILEKQWVASGPEYLHILTMLKLGRTDATWGNNLRPIKMLVNLTQDRDHIIAENAKKSLWALPAASLPALATAWGTNKAAIIEDILVAKSFIPSKPLELRVRTALALGRASDILATNNEFSELLKLCENSDEILSHRARQTLYELPESRLDTLYNLWVQTRQAFLEDVINKRKYLPKKSGAARVMVALQLGQWERIAENGKAAVVVHLAKACTDKDALIAERAQLALAALQKTEAQQELCRLIIKEELPIPQKIALEKNYLPSQTHEKVLYYFVTEQWEKYETLDFDQRILRTAYAAAEPSLRRRLANKVRKAGRTEYLSVISGSSDLRGNNANLSRDEAELLVQLLSANAEWGKLWSLVYELPFYFSVQIVQKLEEAKWQPSREDERLLLKQMQDLMRGQALTEFSQVEKLLPPAVLRARARAAGRINDVAFAPDAAHIAVATGTGKVILWNMQTGKRERVLTDFNPMGKHSIGNLVYTKNGTLVCTETTNTRNGVCGVYAWYGDAWHSDGKPKRIGQHNGPVTALAAFRDSEQVITTGRDYTAKLWNVAEGTLVKQKQLLLNPNYEVQFWARGICVSPDESEAGFLHEGVTLMSLPDFNFIHYSQSKKKVISGAFAPDDSTLLVCKYDFGIKRYSYQKGNYINEAYNKFMDASGRQEDQIWQNVDAHAIAVQPKNDVVIVGEGNGTIRFNDWNKREWLGKVATNGKSLTSLKISPDGYFMAVGDSDASFSLWDLRPLEIQNLLTQNLAQATVSQMAALNVLTAPDVLAALSHQTQAAVQFLALLLNQRFRHEIELDEMPMLVGGDFDIEIEG